MIRSSLLILLLAFLAPSAVQFPRFVPRCCRCATMLRRAGCGAAGATRRRTTRVATDLARDRERAWTLFCEWTESESLRKHVLAVEAAMRAYARRFGEDEEAWAVVGILHDLDYERYPTMDGTGHPFKAVEYLALRWLPGGRDARHPLACGLQRRDARVAHGAYALRGGRVDRLHQRGRARPPIEARRGCGREIGAQEDEGQSVRAGRQPG